MNQNKTEANKEQRPTDVASGAVLGDDRESIQWTPKQLAAARRVGKRMAKIFPPPKGITPKWRTITINGVKLKVA